MAENEKFRPGFRPAGILGSRRLPEKALRAVFAYAAAHAASGGETWTGGAPGADSAGLAGAQAVGGKCRVYLAGTVGDVAQGKGDALWSRPRELVRRCRAGEVREFAGGKEGRYIWRLCSRTGKLLRDLRGMVGAEVWVFIGEASYRAKRGGSVQTIREAMRLGFTPGEALRVWRVDGDGNLERVDREQLTLDF